MSARSRSAPWFAVSLKQRIAWEVDGKLCKHGEVIAGDPVQCSHCGAVQYPTAAYGCLACDMENAWKWMQHHVRETDQPGELSATFIPS
jgi:hypothetical protein